MTRIKQCSENRLLVNNDYVLNEMPETIYRMAYILDISTRRRGYFHKFNIPSPTEFQVLLGYYILLKGTEKVSFQYAIVVVAYHVCLKSFPNQWWMDDVRKQRNHFRLQCLSNRSKAEKKTEKYESLFTYLRIFEM